MYQRFIQLVLTICMVFSGNVLAKDTLPLMPMPKEISWQNGQLTLEKSFTWHGKNITSEQRNHIQQLLNRRLSNIANQHIVPSFTDKSLNNLNLLIDIRKLTSNTYPTMDNDESYQLKVNSTHITLQANEIWGALHGLQTLLQLSKFELNKFVIPHVVINDEPRFKWRGLMVDSVRHFMPIALIKRQIEAMAAAKLNVFHWHLTDDQGWRIPIDGYEKLHLTASDGLYYSHEEIIDLVSYAAAFGIRVIPEVDLPGHASAIAVAYPNLITEKRSYPMQRQWGVFEPVLDVSDAAVDQFSEAIVQQLVKLFPDDYVHIGGDEVNPKQWLNSESIAQLMQANKLKSADEVHSYFNRKLSTLLTKYQRKLMGWDEIYHPDLPRTALIQSWRGLGSLTEITADGFNGILSAGFYIDQPQPAAYHYSNDPQQSHTITLPKESPTGYLSLEMPRLKGSAVKINLAYWTNENGHSALVQFNNKPAKFIHNFNFTEHQASFSVNTWMGPTSAKLRIDSSQNISGHVLIGNTPYKTTGTLLDWQKVSPQSADKLMQSALNKPLKERSIWGGEATIWTELVTSNTLEQRVWPRTFVIAERLWSPKSITDIDSMYQRLTALDKWAVLSLKLGYKQQQQHILQSLAPEDDITPLLILSEQVEQAQYYTRHHVKYQQGLYHQLAPLDNFVDSLPSQSLALIALQQEVTAYLKTRSANKFNYVMQTLDRWQSNGTDLSTLIARHHGLSHLQQLASHANAINESSIELLTAINNNARLSAKKINAMKQLTNLDTLRYNEIVVSNAYILISLLAHYDNMPTQH